MPSRRNPRSSDYPPGLENLANACYQNSVIQGLSSLECLPQYLDHVSSSAKIPDKSMATILSFTHQYLNDPSASYFDPKLLRKLKKVNAWNMNVWNQADVDEYLNALLDSIDLEHTRAIQELADSNGLAEAKDEVEKRAIICKLKSDSPNPLEGYTLETVPCTTCGYSEPGNLHPFVCSNIPIPPKSNYKLPFAWLLHKYFESELIEGARCTYCSLRELAKFLNKADPEIANELLGKVEECFESPKEMDELAKAYKLEIWKDGKSIERTKKKEVKIVAPPKAFAFHIKRTYWNEYGLRKFSNTIKFPLVLDMNNFYKEPSGDILKQISKKDDATLKYRLKAIIEHFGPDGRGHYICHRTWGKPTEPGQPTWFTADDLMVYSMGETCIEKCFAACMALYEEIPTPENERKRRRETSVNTENGEDEVEEYLPLPPPKRFHLSPEYEIEEEVAPALEVTEIRVDEDELEPNEMLAKPEAPEKQDSVEKEVNSELQNQPESPKVGEYVNGVVEAEVNGIAEVNGEAYINGDSKNNGDVFKNGEAKTNGDFHSNGGVESNGDAVTIDDVHSKVDIVSNGDVTTNGDFHSKGDIESSADVLANGEAKTNGKVHKNGDFLINGYVGTKEDVKVNDEAKPNGNMITHSNTLANGYMIFNGDATYTDKHEGGVKPSNHAEQKANDPLQLVEKSVNGEETVEKATLQLFSPKAKETAPVHYKKRSMKNKGRKRY